MAEVDLSPYNVVIIVFAMPECGACETYLPRLIERSQAHGAPFEVFDGGRAPAKGRVPILTYDVASDDKAVQQFADQYQVTSTPTTLVLRRGPGSFKLEGALSPGQIDYVLAVAKEANS